MEGFWKTLLDKVSIEIFFMTLFLFGLSLVGLFFLSIQISPVFIVAYTCLSISLSYFVSRLIVFIISSLRKTHGLNKTNKEYQSLSQKDKRLLLNLMPVGDVGIFVSNEFSDSVKKLTLFNFIVPIKNGGLKGYVYIVNPKYKHQLSKLLIKDK